MNPTLCLGTAQFGLPYGITNTTGTVPEKEVSEILKQAQLAGISLLDTAQAYGDAESVLGRNLPAGHSFQLISKLSPQPQRNFTREDLLKWQHSLQNSLIHLGVTSIDAILLHSTDDLRKPGSEYLVNWLHELRESGVVQRLGVSIYEADDLKGIPNDLLDIVQLPLSIYDQRLLNDGTIDHLKSQGCAVHARSIYLQGLLLTESKNWPAWISPEIRNHHMSLEKFAYDRDIDLLSCVLGFALDQEAIEAIVVGLCSCLELQQLIKSCKAGSPFTNKEWTSWSLSCDNFLDPRCWPK